MRVSAAVMLFALAGCGDSPERVAGKFVDLYFVEIDQARARPLTIGLARQKLDDELHLVETVRREYQAEQAKPSIFYKERSHALVGSEHARVSYDLTVRHEQDVELKKQVMISVEREGGAWRIANFVVSDGESPAPPPSAPSR